MTSALRTSPPPPSAPPSAPVAAIIGGAGGIGVATARALARRGWRLALVDLDAARLATAAEQVAHALAPPPPADLVRCYPSDITQSAEAAATIERLIADAGRLDLVVESAGLTQISPFAATDLAVLRRVMEVNLFGVAATLRPALPALMAARGRIAVLSSVCGFAPLLGRSGYCASKHALHGLVDTLRAELAPHGVSLTTVCPSFVDTDFASRGLAGDGAPLDRARTITGSPLSAEQLGEALVRAVLARRRLLLVGREARLSYWLARLVPTWYDRLMRRRFGALLETRPLEPVGRSEHRP